MEEVFDVGKKGGRVMKGCGREVDAERGHQK